MTSKTRLIWALLYNRRGSLKQTDSLRLLCWPLRTPACLRRSHSRAEFFAFAPGCRSDHGLLGHLLHMSSVRLYILYALAATNLAVAGTDFCPERLARLRREVTAAVQRGEYPGVNVVLTAHGQTVFAASFGQRDLAADKPMEPDTIFVAASMTKPLTAVAVMMLYEEGRFLLEDPVAKYLPEFAHLQVLVSEGGDPAQVVPAASPITIRQLLTHTSGLFNFKGYAAAGINPKLNLEATVAKLATVPLSHQPGAAWRYGLSYDVLARLVEVCSGQRFDAFLANRIFRPLGMTDTAFHVPASKSARLALGYRQNDAGVLEPLPRQGAPTEPPTYLSGGGGLYTTIGDFQRFAQMLLNGGVLYGQRLLSPLTVEHMFRSHVPPGVMPPDGPNGRRGYGMGLGGYVLVDPAASEDLGVEGEYNGAGVGGTFYFVDRRNGVVGLWFSQRYPQVQTTLKRFKVLVYQALVSAPGG